MDESTAAAFETFASGLLGRASPAAEDAMGAEFDPRVRDSMDLAHHGEGLVGLEHLCANLSDFEVALTADERAALRRFTDAWRLGDPTRALVGLPPAG